MVLAPNFNELFREEITPRQNGSHLGDATVQTAVDLAFSESDRTFVWERDANITAVFLNKDSLFDKSKSYKQVL